MSVYKLIRDLRDFEEAENVKTSDYFVAASNPDGSAVEETFRMSIAELVSQYNKDKANEQSDPNNPLGNNTASTVEVIDGQEVIVDATPVTSANLDSLVDPGSGLEVISTCFDASYTEVPCEDPPGTINPVVKYKKKKLSFAKSAASKNLTLRVSNTGIVYNENKSSFAVGSDGSVDQRFLTLRSAYDYINDQVVSTSVTINIYIETDIDEGFTYKNGYRLNLSYSRVNIYGADWNSSSLKVIKLRHGVGYTLATDPALSAEWDNMPQAKAGVYQGRTGSVMSSLPAGVSLYQYATVPFWINNTTYWRGVHFVLETYCNGVFAAYRQTRATHGYFAQCKWSVKDYNTEDGTKHGIARLFDVRDNSFLHIQNVNDGTPNDDLKDPANKGGVVSGLELDLDDLGFVHTIFDIEDGAKVLILEYGSHLYSPATTIASRLCFSSNVNNCTRFMHLSRGSTIQHNTLLTRNLGVTLNIDYSLAATGFCNLSTSPNQTDESGTAKTNTWPGATFYDPNVIVDVDIRNAGSISNGTLHELASYYSNYTAWSPE